MAIIRIQIHSVKAVSFHFRFLARLVVAISSYDLSQNGNVRCWRKPAATVAFVVISWNCV